MGTRRGELPWKTALVTGASSGLGRGLCGWLARRGVTVWGAARRVEVVEADAQALGSDGTLHALKWDVADAQATVQAVKALDASCGGLDLVVANAGVAYETAGESQDWATIRETVDVNVLGALATLVGAAPGMVRRGRGQLVGVSSLAGMRGMPRYAAYSASKAFLSTYLESLRGDLRGKGVVVSTVHPGYVRTPGTDKNQFPMPFLLELDDAVNRLGRGLARGAAEVNFPWPLVFTSKLLRWLPNGLWDWASQRAGPKPGSR